MSETDRLDLYLHDYQLRKLAVLGQRAVMSMVNVGDYVLATKYSDGDPCDHFFVGFIAGHTDHGRYLIVDNEGVSQRANGFRRVERLTSGEGRQLIELIPSISDKHGPSLWWHLSNIRGVGRENFCDECKYELDGACRCER